MGWCHAGNFSTANSAFDGAGQRSVSDSTKPHVSLQMRPMSSTSHRPGRPTSAIGSRSSSARPHTAPGVRSGRAANSRVFNLTEERLRQQVVAECERLTATPEGSVANEYGNQDISSAISDAEGTSWNGSKELYLRLLNED